MKKKGFTLAEILVSLGIIGIVAAIVLPTFISSHKQQVHEATRKSAESVLENTLSAMMAAEYAEDLSFTKIWAENQNVTNMKNTLGEYTKASFVTSEIADGVGMMLKSGAVISIKTTPSSLTKAADVRIDTNGSSEPNKRDVDQFHYELKYNGSLKYVKGN